MANLGDYRLKRGNLYMSLYVFLIICFFFGFVWNYFLNGNGESGVRIDADSFVYIELNEIYDNIFVLFSINPNAIGQLFLLRITDSSYFTIFLINLILFIFSYKFFLKSFELDNKLFAVLLICNPLFIPVITTLNKEIFGLASIAFYFHFLVYRKKRMVLFSLLFAIVTRWQMVFIILFFHFFRFVTKYLKINRGLSLLLFILLLSAMYPVFFAGFTNVIEDRTADRQQETAGGMINFFNSIQNYYLYFISVIPKAFFNLFGNFFRVFTMIVNPSKTDFKDMYNNVFMLGHQIMMFVLTVWMAIKKKIKIDNDMVYFCCVYLIVFSMGPMIQYRYIFPIYIIFAAIVAQVHSEKPGELYDTLRKI